MQIPVFGPFVIWPINSYVTPRAYFLGVSMGIGSFETRFNLIAGIWRAGLFYCFHAHGIIGSVRVFCVVKYIPCINARFGFSQLNRLEHGVL